MQIFKIYKQQKNARSNWATTLWSKLNPKLLDEGIDAFIIDFELLEKWVNEMKQKKMNLKRRFTTD